MEELKLFFVQSPNGPSLFETSLFSHYCPEEIRAMRGSCNVIPSYVSFPWSAGVRALAYFFVRNALARSNAQYSDSKDWILDGMLYGGKGSMASSLDYAISKEPAWLLDMFGVLSGGQAIIRKFIKRFNPERKLPGPVRLSLNPKDPINISVYLDGVHLSSSNELRKLATELAEHGGEQKSTGSSAEGLQSGGVLLNLFKPTSIRQSYNIRLAS